MISKNNNSEQIHFIGICGTAMGSVAAALKNRGYIVTGSDQNVYPPMSDFLIENGVSFFTGQAINIALKMSTKENLQNVKE